MSKTELCSECGKVIWKHATNCNIGKIQAAEDRGFVAGWNQACELMPDPMRVRTEEEIRTQYMLDDQPSGEGFSLEDYKDGTVQRIMDDLSGTPDAFKGSSDTKTENFVSGWAAGIQDVIGWIERNYSRKKSEGIISWKDGSAAEIVSWLKSQSNEPDNGDGDKTTVNKKLTVPKPTTKCETCPGCGGVGRVGSPSVQRWCPDCHGKGVV